MLPKISLLDELRKGGYEASLITTFNAYLPFYEEVVLRRLVNAGVRHNVLMMDAGQYAASMANHPPRIAGRRYSLLPIAVPGAFHPKLIMLLGKSKGLVAVGSHNMTLAGFGFNRELTNVVRIQDENDTEGVSIAHDAWSEVTSWIDKFSSGVPKQVLDMVRRCHDFAPWLKNTESSQSDTRLLAARPGLRSLWEQITDLIEGEATDISVTGAFFDQKLSFLRRIRSDLKSARVVVGVDPRTVQIPPVARDLSDVLLHRADRLGLEGTDNEGGSRYLHAKALLIRQSDGRAIFACGSANPSRPAWLAQEGAGNVELMLVQQGAKAIDAATEVGFAGLIDHPPLGEIEWQQIAENQLHETSWDGPKHRTGLAVVEGGAVNLQHAMVEGLESPEYELVAGDGSGIGRTKRFEDDGLTVTVQFPNSQLARANWLSCFVAGELVLKLLLHHAREIEEQAETGVQRRFKEALLSLNTDAPNIGLLIECIDKIVFSQDPGKSADTIREATARTSEEPTREGKDLGTLAIDVENITKRKPKNRLQHSSDFAYLLDALIYHLRIQDFEPVEELDSHGRSEEEQIEADDDENSEERRISPEEQNELINLCHGKVRTLVNRMLGQIEAYRDGRQELEPLLMRLLGVLAVLRELRNCDGRVAWVEKGKTTVPEAERLRLLEGVMFNLFEGTPSLLKMESLGEELEGSDDVARVKGLVVWLAWDCDISLNLEKPFMESSEEFEIRLRQNAMVLALAQMMSDDEVIVDEARNSIGSLTSSELDWLKAMQRFVSWCEQLVLDKSSLRPADEAEPGDIAVHKTIDNWNLRFVSNRGGRFVSLLRLDSKKPFINYQRDHVSIASPHGK